MNATDRQGGRSERLRTEVWYLLLLAILVVISTLSLSEGNESDAAHVEWPRSSECILWRHGAKSNMRC